MSANFEIKRKTAVGRQAGRKPAINEAGIWGAIGAGWSQRYGNFQQLGVSLESHDFNLSKPFDWSRSFHPQSIELCINLSGVGSVVTQTNELLFEPGVLGFYAEGNSGLRAQRQPGSPHRFITVEFSHAFLRERLSACDGALHPLVENFIANPACAGLGSKHRLTTDQERMAAQFLRPSVVTAARDLWYQSKVLELIVSLFFERAGNDEFFCDRQKRVARERVDRVTALLSSRLAEPPALDEIGRAAGCSSFHLSRTFSQEMGMTIPQYLRKLRVERAAELLRSGNYNVTEAAGEVGYSSLSHFSQAFCQLMGCCPALYPAKARSINAPPSVKP